MVAECEWCGEPVGELGQARYPSCGENHRAYASRARGRLRRWLLSVDDETDRELVALPDRVIRSTLADVAEACVQLGGDARTVQPFAFGLASVLARACIAHPGHDRQFWLAQFRRRLAWSECAGLRAALARSLRVKVDEPTGEARP